MFRAILHSIEPTLRATSAALNESVTLTGETPTENPFPCRQIDGFGRATLDRRATDRYICGLFAD
ncbi:hypothetical protein C451_17835 [Halococcus thailandensis JCM 13552]|uniref:Uncharacterized protein n=1 Tax=Halococcus thailandensis JCM 13552 TaxID=1227457 RepID=M0MZX3_9EURY|nr:hypothetical protein C451_17835 [Halococcus thailandensis JCM 13552]